MRAVGIGPKPCFGSFFVSCDVMNDVGFTGRFGSQNSMTCSLTGLTWAIHMLFGQNYFYDG